MNNDVRSGVDVVSKEFSEMLMFSCRQLLNFLYAMSRSFGDEQDALLVTQLNEVIDK